jgi:hypothetical protein
MTTQTDRSDEVVRWKVISVALGLSVVSVALFWAYAANPELAGWKASLLQNIASVLLISGITTFLGEWLIRRDQLHQFRLTEARILRSVVPAAQQRLQDLGLVDCVSDAASFQYKPFIDSAKELHVCVNDGKSWLGQNHSAIKAHLLKEQSELQFFLVSPDSQYLPILADKTNMRLDELQTKIRSSSRLLADYHKSVSATSCVLKIYWHNLPVVHALYMSDTVALVTPYMVSRPRAEVPLFQFGNINPQSYYRRIREDLARIADERDTQLVFHAEQGKVVIDTIAVAPGGTKG